MEQIHGNGSLLCDLDINSVLLNPSKALLTSLIVQEEIEFIQKRNIFEKEEKFTVALLSLSKGSEFQSRCNVHATPRLRNGKSQMSKSQHMWICSLTGTVCADLNLKIKEFFTQRADLFSDF